MCMMSDMAGTLIPDWPIPHRLRRAIEVAHITRPQLAAHLHKSTTTVDNYLTGRTRPDYSTLRHVADLTGVAEWWLEGHDVNPSGGVAELQDRRSRKRGEQPGSGLTWTPARVLQAVA